MMPFVSQAQRRKFGAMLKRGEISQATFDEWSAATKGKLPERKKVKLKKKSKTKKKLPPWLQAKKDKAAGSKDVTPIPKPKKKAKKRGAAKH